MSNYCVHKPRAIFFVTAEFANWGVTLRTTHLKGRAYRNKLASYISVEDTLTESPESFIERKKLCGYCRRYTNLFISPKCKTPRDIFRNSGYKIVRDKEKADHIVVPEFPKKITKLSCDVIFWYPETSELYLVTANRRLRIRTGTPSFEPDSDFERLVANMEEYCYGHTFQTKFPNQKQEVYFYPMCDEYAEMLQGDDNRNYILEHNVEHTMPIAINLDTLRVWAAESDHVQVAKAIASSNWKEYPATLITFLYIEKRYALAATKEGMDIANYLGFETNVSLERMLKNRIIEPDDWNMLQNYICERLGINEEGYSANTRISNHRLFNALHFLIPARLYLKPLRINQPVAYENLAEMIENDHVVCL